MELPTSALHLLLLMVIHLHARPSLYPEMEEDWSDLPPVVSALRKDAIYDVTDDNKEDRKEDESNLQNNNITSEYFDYDYENRVDLNDTLDMVNDIDVEMNEPSTELNETTNKTVKINDKKKDEKQTQSNVRPMSSSIEILPYLFSYPEEGQDLGGSNLVNFEYKNTQFLPRTKKRLGYNHHQQPSKQYGSSYTFGHSSRPGHDHGQINKNGHGHKNNRRHQHQHGQHQGQANLNGHKHGHEQGHGVPVQSGYGHHGHRRQHRPHGIHDYGQLSTIYKAQVFGHGKQQQLSLPDPSRAASYNTHNAQQAEHTRTLQHGQQAGSAGGYLGWDKSA